MYHAWRMYVLFLVQVCTFLFLLRTPVHLCTVFLKGIWNKINNYIPLIN